MIFENIPTYSVSDINRYIKSLLNNDENLKFIQVRGEISNFKPGANGHLYFSLKDKECLINAAMFNNYASKLIFQPKNGDEVTVIASVDAYPIRGTYQLIVYEMHQNGEGTILVELEKLKKKLFNEGLFDQNRKKDINIYPQAIGVITALNGAAVRDIVTNIKRRYPIADIYVFSSAVQGESAPKELLEAFNKAQEYPLDTLIIGRGGGASEDLSAFNDETLVRAIANSKMPVIAAVGHEIDSTLVDYVADKRASTPTGAAELATVDKRELLLRFQNALDDMKEAISNQVNDMKESLEDSKESLNTSFINYLNNLKMLIESKKQHLSALNPKNILNRGYSLTEDMDGHLVSSIKNVKKGNKIVTHLKDGKITSVVE